MSSHRYIITGQVQGVGFRRYVREQGNILALDVSAKNLDNGAVEVKVSGAENQAEKLRARFKDGPGRVESITEKGGKVDYSTKSICIVDNGNYTSFAEHLAPSFAKCYYYTPRSDPSFPTTNADLVGYGLPGVERILDIWAQPLHDNIDLWVFLDVYDGNLQMHLREGGHRVWGSGNGDELELDRVASKKKLKELGFSVGKYRVVTGLDALESWLKMHEDQHVKVSRTRGDMETFFSKNWKEIEPRIDQLRHQLGPAHKVMEFICEDRIDDAVEIAFDGYTIDGQFPDRTMLGIEIKDKGYVGFGREAAKWPKQIVDSNRMISETLRNYQYRNFYCNELRVTKDGTAWAIDPCCRVPMPPGELDLVMYKNLPEILWEGAAGNLVQPELAGKVGVELLIHSTYAEENWQSIQYPKKLEPYVKLRRHCIIDKQRYIIPQWVGLPEVGAVVCVGDNLEDTIAEVEEYAEEVEGYDISVNKGALEDAKDQVAKLKEYGINL